MKIWHYISMALAFVVMVLKVALSSEKRKAAEKDRDIAKSSEKAKDKATEALVRGINEESKPITRNGRTLK